MYPFEMGYHFGVVLQSNKLLSVEMSSIRHQLEKDFENFLNFCEKENLTPDEFRDVCKPLTSAWRLQFWKRVGFALSMLLFIWWLCSNVEVFAWSSSAVGRLLLIELLPFWNWTPLYNARCLVDKSFPRNELTSTTQRYDTDRANCVLCESLEHVSSLGNVTYSMIEQSYLERGLPVIINDSHSSQSLEEFIDAMLTDQDGILDSDPCDVETNLVLKKFFTIGAALEKIEANGKSDEWFIQLRNCQFRAVKASRKLIRRPYYYPLHFEPFYSSWILMSNNYKGMEREIFVDGLVFVQQLSGEIFIHLIPKSPCDKLCLDMKMTLKAGQCLAFSTDLWIFNYQSVDGFEAITTIMEIDWRY